MHTAFATQPFLGPEMLTAAKHPKVRELDAGYSSSEALPLLVAESCFVHALLHPFSASVQMLHRTEPAQGLVGAFPSTAALTAAVSLAAAAATIALASPGATPVKTAEASAVAIAGAAAAAVVATARVLTVANAVTIAEKTAAASAVAPAAAATIAATIVATAMASPGSAAVAIVTTAVTTAGAIQASAVAGSVEVLAIPELFAATPETGLLANLAVIVGRVPAVAVVAIAASIAVTIAWAAD